MGWVSPNDDPDRVAEVSIRERWKMSQVSRTVFMEGLLRWSGGW